MQKHYNFRVENTFELSFDKKRESGVFLIPLMAGILRLHFL
ncbi:hypothetical protein [Flavobacterium sp. CFS9]